jgi:hypothetical protein
MICPAKRAPIATHVIQSILCVFIVYILFIIPHNAQMAISDGIYICSFRIVRLLITPTHINAHSDIYISYPPTISS